MYVEKLREEIFKAIEASDDPRTVILLSDLFDDVVRLETIVYESTSKKSKGTSRRKEARKLFNDIKRSLRALKREKRTQAVVESLSKWYLYAVSGAAAAALFPGIETLLKQAMNVDPNMGLNYLVPLLKELLSTLI